ncbi:MAG TPA: bifunctional 5,10-methylenetetrahydrofolate dehydrogenase/5,10-methenyltetrahydrofolate cyclohydrolase [Candidatus Desulfaltia sp.]|nr:bifunctional 5,10-methylenetetrahydrofolate dehydrogenase/5,10-methenyltetrahydrofolate cyclohydrolase [Candidatus Desulfaltia sp.]
MAISLEGKTLADRIKEEVKQKTAHYRETIGKVPGLTAVLVGDNKASQVYVRSKEKACRELGLFSEVQAYAGDISQALLLGKIGELNRRDEVDGILVQLPLPAQIDPFAIVCALSPEKDVDGLHPFNLGTILANKTGFRPCTPLGVIEMLKAYKIPIEGRDVVVIGRSLLVGKSLAAMLTNENGTVTICHSKTRDLDKVCSRADILIAAMGKEAFVKPEFVKPGATVIDVGINSVSDPARVRAYFGDDEKRQKDLQAKGYTLVGDVHPAAFERAGAMTPVPRGVGPLTIAMLMKNTLTAFERRRVGA